jgi:hypothetical protein
VDVYQKIEKNIRRVVKIFRVKTKQETDLRVTRHASREPAPGRSWHMFNKYEPQMSVFAYSSKDSFITATEYGQSSGAPELSCFSPDCE